MHGSKHTWTVAMFVHTFRCGRLRHLRAVGANLTLVFHVTQARSTFYVLRATSEKFGLHAGNIKLNAHSEVCISIRIIICRALSLYLSVHHTQ